MSKFVWIPQSQAAERRCEEKKIKNGVNDLFIVAHALSMNAILVTDNTREFECIDGLKLKIG